MSQVMLKSAVALSVLIAATSCAPNNNMKEALPQLSEASKQCTRKLSATLTEIADCLDAMEEPVIAKHIPAAINSYHIFSQARHQLSEETDRQ